MTTPQSVDVRLRAAIDAAPSGILATDGDGRIVLANRQIEILFGYPREALIGKPVEMLLPEDVRAEHVVHRTAFLRSPRARAMGEGRELFGLRRDGAKVPLEIQLTPVVTEEGLFVLSILVDISARKRAEARFKVAVESSPSGMIMVDRAGTIVLVNREIERMFGYSRDELLGRSVELLVPEQLRARHPSDRDAYFANPRSRAMGVNRNLSGVRKDGTEFPLEIGLNPIETDEGVFVLGSVVDTSARKHEEAARRHLEDQLRQAQKLEAIGRLASGIAHDFNNVLMGIVGCGGVVKHMLAAGDPARELVDDMCTSAQRGATLSRDLLDLGRHKPVEVLPSEINSVVRVAERMLRRVIGEEIQLEVELCSTGGPILGNPTHIEHILLNLIVNARDAMPRGGRLRVATREVELASTLQTRNRALVPGRYVALEVEDSGIGMDDATQQRLFEPFFTTKPVGSGTGLGLYTVYSIVQQLEAGVDFESSVGRGTKFVIHFPRLTRLEETTAVTKTDAIAKPASPKPTERILVVEDERLIRVTLRHMLTRLGFEVLVAENGSSAIAMARERSGSIDLLLTDMVLPDTTGSELAKLLANEFPALAVVFMSAYPADILVQQGRIAAGTRTLQKPFDESDLVDAVRSALDERRAARTN